MKYKVGDKVKVKSIEWYNENKNKYGEVRCSNMTYFQPYMAKFCGSILTIRNIDVDINVYEVKEANYYWTEDMFEDDDLEFQRAIAKAVHECLWGTDDEIDVYKKTNTTEKFVVDNDSVEFGKNMMKKKISEYLLKHLPMTPDDKEAFVEEMNKYIK
jgi:hypothetical protein